MGKKIYIRLKSLKSVIEAMIGPIDSFTAEELYRREKQKSELPIIPISVHRQQPFVCFPAIDEPGACFIQGGYMTAGYELECQAVSEVFPGNEHAKPGEVIIENECDREFVDFASTEVWQVCDEADADWVIVTDDDDVIQELHRVPTPADDDGIPF